MTAPVRTLGKILEHKPYEDIKMLIRIRSSQYFLRNMSLYTHFFLNQRFVGVFQAAFCFYP